MEQTVLFEVPLCNCVCSGVAHLQIFGELNFWHLFERLVSF